MMTYVSLLEVGLQIIKYSIVKRSLEKALQFEEGILKRNRFVHYGKISFTVHLILCNLTLSTITGISHQ